ncbi:MAG: GntR family transcriptional regulator [Solirubrobacteraceae bacterium]
MSLPDDINDDIERIYDATGRPYRRQGLPPSFPEHIRQILERQVIEGRLEPGERVTEEELARRIGVSRTPVREAMRALEGQGLIERHRGRGISVAERLRPDEAKALYEVRAGLEGHLAGRAAERIDDHELETAARLQWAFQGVLEDDRRADTRKLVALDSDLHWTIYNAAGSTLVATLASYWGRIQRELYDPVYKSNPLLFAQQHDELVQALRSGRADLAEAAMRVHVASGWEAVRASMESLNAQSLATRSAHSPARSGPRSNRGANQNSAGAARS